MAKSKSKKSNPIGKIIAVLFLLALAGGGYYAFDLYKTVYGPSVRIQNDGYLYIPTNASFNNVVDLLYSKGYIKNKAEFTWVAHKKNYHTKVKPGKYLLTNNMSNNDLVNKLRSGDQTPVKITFNSVRTFADLAGKLGSQFEADSSAFMQAFTSNETALKWGFTKERFPAMFIPNTYEFYWTTTPNQFIERMAKEFKQFWTTERIAKAKKLALSQSEVVTLASIVEGETVRKDEMPKVAGLYLNRIRKRMLLQSDPTVKFAVGDFTLRRILTVHTELNHPYNTYKYAGLPPGPIAFPSITAVDAVLNAEEHNYIYMCAKPDGNGYHNFTVSYAQHLRNAKAYHNWLNQNRILR